MGQQTDERNASTFLKCSFCYARCLDPSAKYCDQCGHRRHRKSKLRSKLSKSKTELAESGKVPRTQEQYQMPTGEGAWFWGNSGAPHPSRLPALDATHKNHDVSSLMQKLHIYEVPKAKVRTAEPSQRVSLQDKQALRRVQSFGDAITSRPRGLSLRGKTPITSVVENAGPTLPNQSGALWGTVLEEAIADFEARKTILIAEIESDERCMTVLLQKLQLEAAARSKFVVASSSSQLQMKSTTWTRRHVSTKRSCCK